MVTGDDNSVQIIDISDPDNPIPAGTATDGIGGFTHLSHANDVAIYTIGDNITPTPEAEPEPLPILEYIQCDDKIPADLNLQNADLSNCDLRGADLSGAILTGANLAGADLRGKNIDVDSITDLSNWSIFSTNLTGANLTGANLQGIKYDSKPVEKYLIPGQPEPYISGTFGLPEYFPCKLPDDLTGANLHRCDLSGMDLTGADLTGANLAGADLRNNGFAITDLTGADLTDANLQGIKYAEIIEVEEYDSAAGKSITITKAGTKGLPEYFPCKLPDDLTGANLNHANINDDDFVGANLHRCDLSNMDP